MTRILFLFLLVAFSLLLVGGVFAANNALKYDQQVLDIADQLRCPTCQGLSVKESNSAISEGMKDEIKLKLSQGQSGTEILHYFEQHYGEWILRVPPNEGLNKSIWIAPLFIFILGGVITAVFVAKHKKKNLS